MQAAIRRLVEHPAFHWTILMLILANAAILGAETLPGVRAGAGGVLLALDRAIVWAFVGELALRFLAGPRAYFRSGWNVFDFTIVLISLFAASSGLAALRAFRVLRVLRVVTVIPRMRVVVSALLDAIPGIASVGLILVIIVYVFAVIAAQLYGLAHPALFGDVFLAMYTLFKVLTLDGWAEMATAVAATHPRSWIFFVAFLLIATFTMLNLFVAIIVRVVEEDAEEAMAEQTASLKEEIRALRDEMRRLADRLGP